MVSNVIPLFHKILTSWIPFWNKIDDPRSSSRSNEMIKVIWYCTSHIKSLSPQQLLDLQNLGADYLGLCWIILCESISEIVFMIQCQLQGLKLCPIKWFIFKFTFLPHSSVSRDYNTYHCMHRYIISCMKYGDGEAILCIARLSMCYTATCYGADGCIGSCWCMGDSKYKDSILHIPAKHTQIQWKQPLMVCCFREDYNIMACGVCINRRQSHHPNWFSHFTCV